MPEVRIFVDDCEEMAGVYVDGQLKHFEEFTESEVLLVALSELGVEVEYDLDFMLGLEDENPSFEQLAQTIDAINDFRFNQLELEERRATETRRRDAARLRDQADRLLREAEKLESGL